MTELRGEHGGDDVETTARAERSDLVTRALPIVRELHGLTVKRWELLLMLEEVLGDDIDIEEGLSTLAATIDTEAEVTAAMADELLTDYLP